jgi:hypothetical protein
MLSAMTLAGPSWSPPLHAEVGRRTSSHAKATDGPGAGAVALEELRCISPTAVTMKQSLSLVVTPIDQSLSQPGSKIASVTSSPRQPGSKGSINRLRYSRLHVSVLKQSRSRTAPHQAGPGPPPPLLLLGSSLLGGSLLGGRSLRTTLLRCALLHRHWSFPRSKTYLFESDRHESTGPCANSYQIFQLLEDELEKKCSIFLATRAPASTTHDKT